MSYGANTYGVATYGGAVAPSGKAALVSSSTLTVDATVDTGPAAALSSTSALVVTGATEVAASVAMSSTSVLVVDVDNNRVILVSTSALGVDGTTVKEGSAALAGSSTLTVTATVVLATQGTAALYSASTLTATASVQATSGTPALGSTSVLVVTAAMSSRTGVVTPLRSVSMLQVVASTRVPYVPVVVAGRVILLASSTLGGDFGFVADRSADTMALSLVTSTVRAQPGQLLASIGNGVPYAVVSFTIDGGVTVVTATLDATGTILSVAIPVSGRTVATHVLAASGGGRSAQVNFQVLAVEATTTIVTPVYPPAVPVMVVQRWTFQAYNFSDVNAVMTYTFTLNPDRSSQEFGNIPITSESTTVFNGLILAWEGASSPQKWSWSGRVLTQVDHDAMKFWAGRNDRVWLTDEFRRRYLLKIESLSMTRVRDVNRPWHHQYTMTASALGGVGVLV